MHYTALSVLMILILNAVSNFHFSYLLILYFYALYFQLFYMVALVLSLVSNQNFCHFFWIYNYHKTVMYKIFILIVI